MLVKTAKILRYLVSVDDKLIVPRRQYQNIKLTVTEEQIASTRDHWVLVSSAANCSFIYGATRRHNENINEILPVTNGAYIPEINGAAFTKPPVEIPRRPTSNVKSIIQSTLNNSF